MKQWIVGCLVLLASSSAAAETEAEKIQREVVECAQNMAVGASVLVFMRTEGIDSDEDVKQFALGASTGDSAEDAASISWATTIRNLGLGPSASRNFGTLFTECVRQIFVQYPAITNP